MEPSTSTNYETIVVRQLRRPKADGYFILITVLLLGIRFFLGNKCDFPVDFIFDGYPITKICDFRMLG